MLFIEWRPNCRPSFNYYIECVAKVFYHAAVSLPYLLASLTVVLWSLSARADEPEATFSALSPATDSYFIRLDDSAKNKWGVTVEGAMKHVDVRDQEQIGDCYAQSAAQFFDAWRFTHQDRNYQLQSSGFELNQRFKIQRGDTLINGGDLEKTIPLINIEGTCDQAGLNEMFRNESVDSYATQVMKIYHDNANLFYAEMDKISHLMRASFKNKVDFDRYMAMRDHELRKKYLMDGIEELKAYHTRVLKIPFNRLQKNSKNS